MFSHSVRVASRDVVFACTLSVSLVAAFGASSAMAAPPVLDIIGGNSSNNDLLWLGFDADTVETLNDDASSRVSLRSFGFLKNICQNRLDVLAVDTNRGDILLYANGRGTAIKDYCDAGSCPGRPDGMDISLTRRVSVADTGQGGTTPSVWLFEPAECDGSPFPPYDGPVTSGQIYLSVRGPDPAVTAATDTEFVNILGGGLQSGDLLALVSGPTALVRFNKSDLDALVAGDISTLPPAEVLLDSAFFGDEIPTGMAFIPGTGGIGSDFDGVSQSEDLLITLTGGKLLKLRFQTDGPVTCSAASSCESAQTWADAVFLDQILGNGPLGVDAGTIEDTTLFVVADRQQGSFLRFDLLVDDDGNASLQTNGSGAVLYDVLQAGVQNPQGAAINSDASAANLCVDQPEIPDQTGCRLFRTIDLHYTQLLDEGDTGVLPDDTVLADIQFIVDEGRNSNGELVLGNGFVIPPSCVGLPLPDDDATSVIIYIDITKSFDITTGDFIQYLEAADQIIPQLGDCKEEGTRVFYHPEPGGTLYDTTFYCSNPSRSIGSNNSPIAICADSFYRKIQASNGRLRGRLAQDLKDEVIARASDLRSFIVNDLADAEFDTVRTLLLGHVDAGIADAQRRDFAAASLDFDAGALAVYANKGSETSPILGTLTSENLGPTVYGNFLSRFLALAFFTTETATGGQVGYLPPQPLCDDGELVDVTCRDVP